MKTITKLFNRIISGGTLRLLFAVVGSFVITAALYAAANSALDGALRRTLHDPDSLDVQRKNLTDFLCAKHGGEPPAAKCDSEQDRKHVEETLDAIFLYGDAKKERLGDALRSWTLPYMPSPSLSKSDALGKMLGCADISVLPEDQPKGTICANEETVEKAADSLQAVLGPLRGNIWYVSRRYINGGIQYSTVWMTWAGFLLILLHLWNVRRERAALDRVIGGLVLDDNGAAVSASPAKNARVFAVGERKLSKDDAGVIAAAVKGEADALRERRMEAGTLDALVSINTAFATSGLVHEARSTAQNAEQSLRSTSDSRLASLRYIAWSVPSLGFIGTIVGIGNALNSAYRVATTVGTTKYLQEGAIQAITDELGVAFDTTLVALLASLALMFGIYLVTRLEEQLAERVSGAAELLVQRMQGVQLEEVLNTAFKDRSTQVTLTLGKDQIKEGVSEVLQERDKKIITALEGNGK